jgi:hypothetical protein
MALLGPDRLPDGLIRSRCRQPAELTSGRRVRREHIDGNPSEPGVDVLCAFAADLPDESLGRVRLAFD